MPRDYNPAVGIKSDLSIVTVKTVEDLVDQVNNASPGITVRVAPGTYTLTNTTGKIAIPSGVTLQGAGIGQTIITNDGTLAGALIDQAGATEDVYGIGAEVIESKTVTTDTAADAGNVSKGDLLNIDDGGFGFVTYAAEDGNPGTGVIDLADRLPQAIGATSNVTVFTGFTQDIAIKGLSIVAEGVGTTNGINLKDTINPVVRDVKIDGPGSDDNSGAINIWNVVNPQIDVISDHYNSRCLFYYITGGFINFRAIGGLSEDGSGTGKLNDWANVCYSNVNYLSSGGTGTYCMDMSYSFRNLLDFVIVDACSTKAFAMGGTSDENRINYTCFDGITNNGTGNSLSGT